MAVALAPLGLGSRGFCVLSSAAGRELTQKDLAAEIGIDKTTLVVTLDELEREAWPSAAPRAPTAGPGSSR